jgi:hypothetical protein
MTKINLEYFGMPGSGATVKEAKADAGRRIEAAFDGSYAPFMLSHRGKMLVASRDPKSGWGYRIFDADELKPYTSADHCSCMIKSRDECLLAAVRHLADIARLPGERDSVLFDALRDRDAARERGAFAQKAEQDDTFRTRYNEARERGMGENDARDYAFMNPARRELWAA